MMECIMRCDRCETELKEAWMECEWKGGGRTHLCKKCTADFNDWLKKGVNE